jgi:hypothetical protein
MHSLHIVQSLGLAAIAVETPEISSISKTCIGHMSLNRSARAPVTGSGNRISGRSLYDAVAEGLNLCKYMYMKFNAYETNINRSVYLV